MSDDQTRTSGASILVAEDSLSDVDFITRLLTKHGYTVRSVSESALALPSVQAEPPDLILLDIMMPGMSGYKVCEQLKADERTRDIPVLFLSALGETTDKVKAFEVGGVDYITKPFQANEVLVRIETHLRLRHLQKRLQEENVHLQREIKQRQETERLLRVSEKRLRSIFNHVTFGIFQATRDGRLLTANPALARMLGYASAQELLKNITNIAEQLYVEPHHWHEMTDILQGLQEQVRIETNCRCKDGAEIIVFLTVWCVLDEKSEVLYFEGSLENISERKRTEVAIRRQLVLLDEIFTGIQEGISFIDADEMIIYSNPACDVIFEESIEFLIGRDFFDFFDEESQATILQHHKKIRRGEKATYEVPLTTAKGNPKVLLITASPRFGDDGVYIGAFVTLVNITEHKRAEELLRKLEKAAETTEIGIVLTDNDGRMVYMNPAAAMMHGYTVEELIGQPANMLASPEFQESDAAPELEEGFEELFSLPPERINVRKDGSLFPVKVTSNPIKDPHGHQLGKVMICEDITERKQAEDALLKQANLLRGVAGAMNSLLVTTEFQSALMRALEVLGLATGMDRIAIFEHHTHPETGELLMSQRFTWAQNLFEVQVDTPDLQNLSYINIGLRRWYETLSANSVISGVVKDFPPSERAILEREGIYSTVVIPITIQGRFWGFIRFDNCQTDRQWSEEEESSLLALAGSVGGMIARQEAEVKLITANNELKAALKRLKQTHTQVAAQKVELKRLNASKDKFFSIIAHDLRNPFSGLLGITDFIVKNIEKFRSDEIKEQVAALRDSAETVYTLIENLLAWSRLQRGTMEHHPEQIALDEIAAQNILLFKPNAEQKRITLINQVPKGTIAYADKHMIDTVVRNLTSNALKFTHPGGIIAISATSPGEEVELSISDTGTGISKKDIPKLFQIDVKYSHVGTGGEEGTGLGLILCKDLIERNGGKIWVESEVGQGTVFTILLPANSSTD